MRLYILSAHNTYFVGFISLFFVFDFPMRHFIHVNLYFTHRALCIAVYLFCSLFTVYYALNLCNTHILGSLQIIMTCISFPYGAALGLSYEIL